MTTSDLYDRRDRALRRLLACLLLAGWASATAQSSPAGQDYLDTALRRQVEALKADVRAAPTSRETAPARALVLFDWINAWALAGRYVPVNAPAVVSQASAYGLPVGGAIDAFVAELTLLDERPGALGELAVVADGAFAARSHATFQQVYTVGEAAVQPGGGFLVAQHFQANHGRLQTDDPAAANYLSVRASNPAVSFSVDSYPVAGMHGGFRGAAPQIVFRVADAELEPGDRVTLTYGDRSGGGPGLLMPDFSSDQMPFPVYVALDRTGLWLSLPIQPIRVHGAVVAGVRGFAPSVVAVGERFELSIRAEDRYGNRASGPIPDWTLGVGDRVLRRTPASGAVTVVPDLAFDAPGVYRIVVRSDDGRLVGPTNPILVEQDPLRRIYWGDTHGHSGFAEGIGSADAFMRFARDDARLDFVTHSEHDIWMDDAEWRVLADKVREYTREGRFIAFLGYEWTIRQTQGGHHNVLFRTPEDRQRVPAQRFPTLSSLYQGLRERYPTEDVLIIPHAHNQGDSRLSDPDMETLVEITSMHGTFEWFARMYLERGHEVGFTAASDDHIGRPGYASPKSTSLAQRNGLGAVLAPARTTDALFDAMKRLSAYATSGERILLDVTVNGTPMGQRAAYDRSRRIRGRVIGTAPIRSVTLVKNDQELTTWHYGAPRDDRLALTFRSDSRPYHPGDNPRGWRHWRGTLTLHGATLDGVGASNFDNLSTQHLEIDRDEPQRVHFATHTRGDHSTIFLDVREIRPDATLEVSLEDARETGSGPPFLRRHQDIPGASLVLNAGSLRLGSMVRPMPVDGYGDSVTLEVARQLPSEVTFELTDADHPRHGDYYFVRVRQEDDALAWSSPIWVGGYPPR